MRVGVIQSSYIPWRGYFDFINSVDIFVFHDDIQYTKGDWRNRNKLKTRNGAEWLTVPVSYNNVSQLICNTEIDFSTNWSKKHIQKWNENYRRAPYIEDVNEILAPLGSSGLMTISQLNIELIKRICAYLDIYTPTVLSNELSLVGSKTPRLIDLLKKLKATSYLSGPSAETYLDKKFFFANEIQLEYKNYDYDPYPQLWGDFIGEVSVLDLIANCGLKSRDLIRSKSRNKIINTGQNEMYE